MQAQYRPYPPQGPPQRSPHAPNPRRGGIGPIMPPGPHPPAAMPQAQYPHPQQQTIIEPAKMKARKPTDKSLPNGIEDCLIDPEFMHKYNEARELERRLDATITRKRLDMREGLMRHPKRQRTLRVWITNTVEGQDWQADGGDGFEFAPQEPSFTVKIEGRLLPKDDEEQDSGADANNPDVMDDDGAKDEALAKPTPKRQRFSHFFNALQVTFPESTYRSGSRQAVEWKKPETGPSLHPPAAADFDELTFKRNGDANMNIVIKLTRHDEPERFKFSPELTDVTDMAAGSKQEVAVAVWEYIRAMGLQEDEEKRNFRCDDILKRIVPQPMESGHIPRLQDYISGHLQTLDPIALEYTIRTDEAFHGNPTPTIYDISVLVDDPVHAKLAHVFNLETYGGMLREVNALDDKLVKLIQAINYSKAKHSFLFDLGNDPTIFVRNWLSSQKRDLELIAGDATRAGVEDTTGDEWRRGGPDSVWNTSNARESVNVLLSNPNAFSVALR